MKIRLLLVTVLLSLVVLARRDASGQSNAPNGLLIEIGITNSGVVLKWTDTGAALEGSLVLTGNWSEVIGASSPWIISPTNPATYFRLRGAAPASPTFDFLYLAPSFNTAIGNPVGCGCTSPENPNSLASPGSAQDNAAGALLLHTGEVTQNEVDLEIPGRGFNWRFERRYRSGMNYNGPLGHGWDFNHNHRLVAETNGNMLSVNGLGRVDRYTHASGTYTPPGGFYTRLTRNPDGTYLERDRHGLTNFFSATNISGIARLTRISDRNGNQLQLQYNGLNQLTNVVDTLGRNLSYSYNADGRLTNVTDFTGRSLRFSYDAQQDLVSATTPPVTGTPNGNDFPDGKTTLYNYRTRYFEPAVGRFTTRDSIGIWGDENNLGNAYTYVGNGPATTDDPSGEASKSYSSAKSNTSLAAPAPGDEDDDDDSPESSGPMYAANINTSRSNLKDKGSIAAPGDGIGGVEVGLKKKPGGQLSAASINTTRSNLKDKGSLADLDSGSDASITGSRQDASYLLAAGDGIGGVEVGLKKKPGGQLSAASINTTRSNLKDKGSIAAAGDGIGGVEVGLKKKPGGQLSAASINTTRSNLKDKSSLAAPGPRGSGRGPASASKSYNSAKSNTSFY